MITGITIGVMKNVSKYNLKFACILLTPIAAKVPIGREIAIVTVAAINEFQSARIHLLSLKKLSNHRKLYSLGGNSRKGEAPRLIGKTISIGAIRKMQTIMPIMYIIDFWTDDLL